MVILEKIRLLLVDDDDSFLKLTKLVLTRIRKNLKITTVTSATEALSILKKQLFDVIVSDYQMPKIDGLEFLKDVRRLYSDIPFAGLGTCRELLLPGRWPGWKFDDCKCRNWCFVSRFVCPSLPSHSRKHEGVESYGQ